MFKLIQIVDVTHKIEEDDEGYTFMKANVIVDDKADEFQIYFPPEVLQLFSKHFKKNIYPIGIIQEYS